MAEEQAAQIGLQELESGQMAIVFTVEGEPGFYFEISPEQASVMAEQLAAYAEKAPRIDARSGGQGSGA